MLSTVYHYLLINQHRQKYETLTSILAFVQRGISTTILKTVLSELANNGTSWKGDTIPFGPPIKTTDVYELSAVGANPQR